MAGGSHPMQDSALIPRQPCVTRASRWLGLYMIWYVHYPRLQHRKGGEGCCTCFFCAASPTKGVARRPCRRKDPSAQRESFTFDASSRARSVILPATCPSPPVPLRQSESR